MSAKAQTLFFKEGELVCFVRRGPMSKTSLWDSSWSGFNVSPNYTHRFNAGKSTTSVSAIFLHGDWQGTLLHRLSSPWSTTHMITTRHETRRLHSCEYRTEAQIFAKTCCPARPSIWETQSHLAVVRETYVNVPFVIM
jgi:hypothetical protein